MLAYLNSYIILADTNVWINWKFRAAVKKSTVLQRQLRVPHLVADELKRKQENDPELGKAAKDALKIIEKHKIQILDETHLSFHHADPEFILYGMENAGDAVAVVTADNDLRDDLKALCPGVLILGWDLDAGQFALEGKPEYTELAKQYGKIIASSRAAGRKDFAVLAVMLGRELVETPSGTCSAGESASLLARVVLHCGKQRALLLLAEGEDTLPFMDHRDMKLKSVDNTGFDVAVMDAAGRITVQEPKGKPLPCSKQHRPTPKPKPAPKAAEAPAAKHPGCPAIQQACKEGNTVLAKKHLVDGLKESLRSGRFSQATDLLETAKEHGLGQPKSVLNFYLNNVLDGYVRQKDWKSLKSRFTGKAGKKMLTRLIQNAPVSNIATAPANKLNDWKETCETDEQSEAIAAFAAIIENAQKQE